MQVASIGAKSVAPINLIPLRAWRFGEKFLKDSRPTRNSRFGKPRQPSADATMIHCETRGLPLDLQSGKSRRLSLHENKQASREKYSNRMTRRILERIPTARQSLLWQPNLLCAMSELVEKHRFIGLRPSVANNPFRCCSPRELVLTPRISMAIRRLLGLAGICVQDPFFVCCVMACIGPRKQDR